MSRLLEISTEQKEIDGRLHVVKPTNYSSAQVKHKGTATGLERGTDCKTAEEIKKSLEIAQLHQKKHEQAKDAERLNKPVGHDHYEINQINLRHGKHLIDGSRADKRVMESTTLAEETMKEMKMREVDQQRKDDEDMQDASLLSASKTVKESRAAASVDVEEVKRRLIVEYQTRLLERTAKVESLLITTGQSKKAPKVEAEHLSEEMKKTVQDQQVKHSADADKGIESLRLKVEDYKKAYGAHTTVAPTVANVDAAKDLMAQEDLAYKAFWGRTGHQTPFFLAMKAWKDACEVLRKEAEKQSRAKAVGSAKKRKAIDVDRDFDEESVPIFKAMKAYIEKDLTQSHNLGSSLEEFPARTVVFVDKADEITALCEMAQTQVMIKWARRELTKTEEMDFTATISNKKMTGELKKFETSLDSKINCKTELVFGADGQQDLKKSIFCPQLSCLSDPHCDLNVTSFCFNEVRTQLTGSYLCATIAIAGLEGDTIAEKMEKVLQFGKAQLYDACKRLGSIHTVKPGEVMVIPSGWLVLSMGMDAECNFFRWNFAPKSSFVRVHSTLSMLLQAHEYLAATDYKTLHEIWATQLPSP